MLKSLVLAALLLGSTTASAQIVVLSRNGVPLSQRQLDILEKQNDSIKKTCAVQLDEQPDSRSSEMRACVLDQWQAWDDQLGSPKWSDNVPYVIPSTSR
jgi:hypothetical protein